MGMCVGEKRRLLVPSELVPEIMNKIKLVNDDGEIISGGAGATLFFDIELLEIEDSPAPVNVIYLHPRRGAQCVNLKGNSVAPIYVVNLMIF